MASLLLVDDDEDILDVLRRLLERRGHTLACATDGAAAVDCVRATDTPPDLILMDLRLPRMNGWDAIKAIRAGGATMPIIALSGDTSDEDRARAMIAGADLFMNKPTPIKELSTAIDHLIETRPGS
ncbi:MAG: response regulator [Proteobacteria bacterium]|nr:response regulator [Pseudomonadota bacterium]MDA1060051.1 response regulator [Pseudomonadota bacterium]